MSASRAVIVGAGIAGVSAAAGMRSAGWDGEILLLGDEPELPYRRPPVSKEIVRGDKTADEIRIKPQAWYATQHIELLTGTRVASIDAGSRRVLLDDGSAVAFDRLLLATGGTARTLGSADGVVLLESLLHAAGARSGRHAA